MPDPIPPSTAELEAKISALEKRLAELAKGDPERAQLLARIDKLEKALEAKKADDPKPPADPPAPEEPKRGRWSDHFLM